MHEISAQDESLCRIIWNYLGVQQPCQPADAIIAGGSRDLRVAALAARLFKQGWAPWLVVTGGWHTQLEANEAEAYARVAIARGVPPKQIIKEPTARNTGQNITLAQQCLLERGITPRTVLLVHTPIMSRRFLATAEAQWEGEQPLLISRHEPVDFATYHRRPGMEDTIPRMLGYVARMRPHAEQGFQTPQFVPGEVQAACDLLIACGYEVRGLHQ